MEPQPPNGTDTDEPDAKGQSGPTAGEADKPDADRPLGSLDAVRTFLLVAAGVALLLPIIFALQAPLAIDKVTIAAVGAAIGAAAIAAGALVGFVFGIPTSIQIRRPVPAPGEGGANDEAAALYIGNTSLEQISDWLTKILVGVGLTQLSSIPSGLADLGGFLAGGLGDLPGADVFAATLVVFGLIVGFFLGYLWTRLDLPYLLAKSDLKQLLARAKEQARVEGEQKAFDTVAKTPAPEAAPGKERPEEQAQREAVPKGEGGPGLEAAAEPTTPPSPILALWVDDRPEDNDSVRQVMQQRFDLVFENVNDTDRAIGKLEKDSRRYGFVITDLSRPPDRQAGFTLLRQMQARNIHLPTIIYTGRSASTAVRAEAQRLNAEAITNSPSELFEVVQRLCSRIRMA